MRTALFPLVLAAAASRAPWRAMAAQDTPLGTVYPQPSDVVADDALVHSDSTGGCDQVLRDLAGRPDGGFAAVWSDMRNGNLGLYAGFLSAEGTPGLEQPVSPPRTSRQFEPVVAIGASEFAAVAWYATGWGREGHALRVLDGPPPVRSPGVAPGVAPGAAPVEPFALSQFEGGRGAPRGAPRDRGAAPPGAPSLRRPAVALGSALGFAVWADEATGIVSALRFGRARSVFGEARVLNAQGPAATGAPVAALGPSGEPVVLWPTAGAIAAWGADEAGAFALAEAGAGAPLRVLTDPADPAGGWWLLVLDGPALRMRHLAKNGAPDRPDLSPVTGAAKSADLAVFRSGAGLALLVELAQPESAPFELHLLAPSGEPLVPNAVQLPSAEARGASGPRIAASGDALAVAWTDRRNGDPDVYFRCLTLGDLAGADRRWNGDGGSAAQLAPVVASSGERAVVAWQDERAGAGRIYARELDARGAMRAAEFLVAPAAGAPPDGAPAPHCTSPAAAVHSEGRGLVAWLESDAPGGSAARVRVRPFQAGAPAGHVLDADPGQSAARNSAVAAIALDGERGYALAWVRNGGLPVAARFTESGAAAGAPVALGSADGAGLPAQNVHLARLDDGRAVAVWDAFAPGRPPALFARFLGADAVPLGAPIALPASSEPGDWDPVVAPGPANGFVLAWCGNGGMRDILARRFDASGAPAGAQLAVSPHVNEQDFPSIARLADGSFAVAWEDDISGRDHAALRRISADGAALGPIVTLNQRETLYVEDRFAPCLAAHGAGLIGAWTDCRRSKSKDVYARVLGAGFDRAPTPAASPSPR